MLKSSIKSQNARLDSLKKLARTQKIPANKLYYTKASEYLTTEYTKLEPEFLNLKKQYINENCTPFSTAETKKILKKISSFESTIKSNFSKMLVKKFAIAKANQAQSSSSAPSSSSQNNYGSVPDQGSVVFSDKGLTVRYSETDSYLTIKTDYNNGQSCNLVSSTEIIQSAKYTNPAISKEQIPYFELIINQMKIPNQECRATGLLTDIIGGDKVNFAGRILESGITKENIKTKLGNKDSYKVTIREVPYNPNKVMN
jgi:hypothetical protein